MKARIKFRKYGVMRFIGHLDIMRYFQKAMRRADIPIAFTGGYSPHMIMSFAQPLGVGLTSDGEYLDIELKEPIGSEQAVRRLNAVMVEGIDILSFVQISEEKKASGMTIVAAAEYEVHFLESAKSADVRIGAAQALQRAAGNSGKWKEPTARTLDELIGDFLGQEQIVVLKKSKKSEREVDIKPLIYQMNADGEKLHLFLAAGSEENLKPELVMEAFFCFIGAIPESIPVHYHRLEVYAKSESGGRFVSLESLGSPIRQEAIL